MNNYLKIITMSKTTLISAVFTLGALLSVPAHAAQPTMSYSYDNLGNLLSTLDGLNRTTSNQYDALNRVYQITDPLNNPVNYQYDARDNLVGVTDQNNLTTTYVYDGLDQLVSQVSPNTGAVTYTYDEVGNRLSMTDARGITSHYTYDLLNRVTSISYLDTAKNVTYVYDSCSNGVGRLCQTTDESGTTQYQYDVRGNMIEEARTYNPNSSAIDTQTATVAYTTQYAYDAADNLSAITYPSGKVVSYTRDSAGRIIQVVSDGQTIASNIDYLPFGPTKALTYGNGIQLTQAHDIDYRLTGQTEQGSTQTIRDAEYTYDLVSNIVQIAQQTDATKNQAFQYDALDRLTDAQGSYGDLDYAYDPVGNRTYKGNTTQGETQSLSYDSQSQKLTQIGTTTSTESTTQSRSYDANGNTIELTDNNATTGEATSTVFIYDDQNRLSEVQKDTVTIAAYTYNASGQRVKKTSLRPSTGDLNGDGVVDQNDVVQIAQDRTDCNGDGKINGQDVACVATQQGASKNKGKQLGKEKPNNGNANGAGNKPGGSEGSAPETIHFVYDQQGNLLGEYDKDGQPLNEYIYLGSQRIAATENTSTYYIHSDQLGTAKVITDATQAIVWAAEHDPFGTAIVDETLVASIDHDLRFPGQYYDSETGLHYNYFRDYDPSTGRYIQSDPVGLGGGINTYAYANDNPIRFVDLKGLSPSDCLGYEGDDFLDCLLRDKFGPPEDLIPRLCIRCDEQKFNICMIGTGPSLSYSCGKCLASRGADRKSCVSCALDGTQASVCVIKNCRMTTDCRQTDSCEAKEEDGGQPK